MRYIALIYSDHTIDPAYNSAERQQMRDEYGALTQAMVSAGVLCSGAGLEPITTATTVKGREGKTLTAEGPFAETKEQLGGYYVLDCKDLDDAIQWAPRIPAARWGSVEVRPELSM